MNTRYKYVYKIVFYFGLDSAIYLPLPSSILPRIFRLSNLSSHTIHNSTINESLSLLNNIYILFTGKTFTDCLSFGVKFHRQTSLVVDKLRPAIRKIIKMRKSLRKFRHLHIHANIKSNLSQSNLFRFVQNYKHIVVTQ